MVNVVKCNAIVDNLTEVGAWLIHGSHHRPWVTDNIVASHLSERDIIIITIASGQIQTGTYGGERGKWKQVIPWLLKLMLLHPVALWDSQDSKVCSQIDQKATANNANGHLVFPPWLDKSNSLRFDVQGWYTTSDNCFSFQGILCPNEQTYSRISP